MKTNSLKLLLICSILLPFAVNPTPAQKKYAILHTNDLQSRLLGYGPNSEYSPQTLNDDSTFGGFARLATLIRNQKLELEKQGYTVLVLDGGDITMGTLFHTVARQTGGEFRLLSMAGYDAATIGNHELDYGAEGLAMMIRSAQKHTTHLPKFLMANVHTNPAESGDEELEKLVREKTIVPYHIIEKDGIRFGLFGLMGYNAWDVTARQKPLKFTDPIQTGNEITKILIEKENVDVVILCSHGGVNETENKEFTGSGEDIEFAKKIKGIDIIVGGHSHTPIHKPALVNDQTVVLQAGSEARYLGALKMNLTAPKKSVMEAYQLHDIDDSIPGDPRATRLIAQLIQEINRSVLKKHGFKFDTKMAEIPISFTKKLDDPYLGNLMADSIRKQSGAQIGMTTQGTIRDNLYRGKNGIQWISDLFRLAPLGEGEYSDESGYPLAKLYVRADEIKAMLEVLTFAYRTKGLSYYPRFSGVRFEYNSWRIPLDSVYKIEILNPDGQYERLDYSSENKQLYSVASNIYIARFFPLVEELSKGILKVVPKHQDGTAMKDMNESIIDGDPNTAGVQEIKEWISVIRTIRSYKDTNANGITDIPTDGDLAEVRMVNQPGFSSMFTRATFTYLYLVIVILPIVIGVIVWRKKKRKA